LLADNTGGVAVLLMLFDATEVALADVVTPNV
jgi:hypothetical protein